MNVNRTDHFADRGVGRRGPPLWRGFCVVVVVQASVLHVKLVVRPSSAFGAHHPRHRRRRPCLLQQHTMPCQTTLSVFTHRNRPFPYDCTGKDKVAIETPPKWQLKPPIQPQNVARHIDQGLGIKGDQRGSKGTCRLRITGAVCSRDVINSRSKLLVDYCWHTESSKIAQSSQVIERGFIPAIQESVGSEDAQCFGQECTYPILNNIIIIVFA